MSDLNSNKTHVNNGTGDLYTVMYMNVQVKINDVWVLGVVYEDYRGDIFVLGLADFLYEFTPRLQP